ncbi:hypothetical protein JCM10550A_15820 [Methanogenium cariaci]|jgi:hypothetical protein
MKTKNSASPVPEPSNIEIETGNSMVCATAILARTHKYAPSNEAALRRVEIIERCATDVRPTGGGVYRRSRGQTWFPRGDKHCVYCMKTSYMQVIIQGRASRTAHNRCYIRVRDLDDDRFERIPLFEVTF